MCVTSGMLDVFVLLRKIQYALLSSYQKNELRIKRYIQFLFQIIQKY